MLGLLKSYVNGATATDVGGNPYTILGFGTGENRPAARTALTDAAVYDKAYHQEAVIQTSAAARRTAAPMSLSARAAWARSASRA